MLSINRIKNKSFVIACCDTCNKMLYIETYEDTNKYKVIEELLNQQYWESCTNIKNESIEITHTFCSNKCKRLYSKIEKRNNEL